MRIQLSHATHYHYDTPARSVIQILRLTPRNFEGQHVIDWQLMMDQDCRLQAEQDAFGNSVHIFTLEGQVDSLSVTVRGEIETFDTNGLVRSSPEPIPTGLFLRETRLTIADAALREFARDTCASASTPLDQLHALMVAIHSEMNFDVDQTHAMTTASEAFALRGGVCQDYVHIFIAAARFLGIPARYVGGYFLRSDGVIHQTAGHAWAEAFIAGFGWIGFDPANRVCPHGNHIRVAVGLDYLDAAPVRGHRTGGAGETMQVNITVKPSGNSIGRAQLREQMS